MARQLMSEKNVAHILVRGGTDHRKDLCLEDGTIKHLWPDGTLTECSMRWKALEAQA